MTEPTPGISQQFRSDSFDGGIERGAIVGQLAAKATTRLASRIASCRRSDNESSRGGHAIVRLP